MPRFTPQEELAEGLHLIDFEQLKIENQTYNEKIEERNEASEHLVPLDSDLPILLPCIHFTSGIADLSNRPRFETVYQANCIALV